MEYVGEVLDYHQFEKRTKRYDRENLPHYYFMALNSEEIIDATRKGSPSRFINHSCDPNAETQKVHNPVACLNISKRSHVLRQCRQKTVLK